MIRLILVLLLLSGAAIADETHKFYGPNKEYKGECIDRNDGIEDCYDKNGAYLGRSRVIHEGNREVKQFYGKNLGKPLGSEVTTPR